MSTAENRRILLVDDLPTIHESFRKIPSPTAVTNDLDADEAISRGHTEHGAKRRGHLGRALWKRAELERAFPYAATGWRVPHRYRLFPRIREELCPL
jgi:hypothetical protein